MAGAWKTEQEFYITRQKLHAEEQLFDDSGFPCPAAEEGSPCMWVRPPKLIKSPTFARDNGEPGVVRQGQWSSEAFSVVLNLLQTRRTLWSYVVAQDQSFDRDYAGMFLFRFWRFDKIEPIIIDDVLPFNVDTKIFMLSTLTNAPDMWCVLMEKAYAKYLGGYEHLKSVTVSQAISEILGCSVQLYTLNNVRTKISKTLKIVCELDNVAIAKINFSTAAPEIFRPELIHSLYVVTSLSMENDDKGRPQSIVTLRNPWLQPGTLYANSADLECSFAVTLREFTHIFSKLYVGLPRFPLLFSSPGFRGWETLTITGKWGRCKSIDSEQLSYPFVRIKASKPDLYGEMRFCTVNLSLMQNCESPGLLDIGLLVYSLLGNEQFQRKLPINKLALSQPLVRTENYSTKEISLHLSLEPGQYLVVLNTKESCYCRTRPRYLLTLYSIEQITLMNGVPQRYGEELLSPLNIAISACQYVVVGQPIIVAAMITDFPNISRLSMTVLLSLCRTSSNDPHETAIKVRMEQLEVCQGLMDKELVLRVYYHEYIRFPVQGEQFIARCSAFIHELSCEVKAHAMVTTVLPKVKVALDKHLITGKTAMVSAMLYNSLPMTIRRSKFRIRCSSAGNNTWVTGSSYDLPPFATIWIICRLETKEPRCHQINVYFLSEEFKRSVSLRVQSKDPNNHMSEECLTGVDQLLGEKCSLVPEQGAPTMISCCIKHREVALEHVKISWYPINRTAESKSTGITEESPEEIFYCNVDMMRDNTPSYDPPHDQILNDTEIQTKM